MASIIYDSAKKAFLDGTITSGSTIKAMLVGTGYTADAGHVYVSSASGYELSGTGYTGGYGGSGRKTLASKTVTVDSVESRAVFDAADLTWTSISAGTAAAVVLVVETGGSDATSLLVAYCDIPDYVTDGGNLAVTWPDSGIFWLG